MLFLTTQVRVKALLVMTVVMTESDQSWTSFDDKVEDLPALHYTVIDIQPPPPWIERIDERNAKCRNSTKKRFQIRKWELQQRKEQPAAVFADFPMLPLVTLLST